MVVLRPMRFRVVIKKIDHPFSESVQDELDWICQSLGFFEEIDKDKTASAVFRIIWMATENREALSSTTIADRVSMSRGAVLNHLTNLQRSGLIEKHGRFYIARSQSLYRTMEELQEDIDRIFEKLKTRAKFIDAKFNQRMRL